MRPRPFSFVLLAALVFVPAVFATPAAQPNTVLILGTTVVGGASSDEALAAVGLGYTVEVADATQWAAKTTSDFASYKAIILGDPTCVVGTAPVAPAEANNTTWGPAITGNVIVVGSDPSYHSPATAGATTLIQSAIGFAASGSSTGAYISLSCYYDGAAPTTVPVLAPFGSFTAADAAGCFDTVHIVASHPALAGSTDASLSNWGCSVHEVLQAYPGSFAALAIAQGQTGPGMLTFPDNTSGVPYIVARGEGLVTVGCGNGVIDVGAGEQCDDGNTVSGDGCSSSCRLEASAVDLNATKTASPTAVSLGDNVTYTIAITNSGTTSATGVTLSDPLPTGLSFVSVDTTQGSCTGGATVNCSLGTIAGAGTATVTIVARVTVPGITIENAAELDSNETTPKAILVGSGGTVIVAPAQIPTTSELALAVLAIILAMAGALVLRTR